MIRLASEFDTSGKVTGISSKEPSSSGGINSVPRLTTSGTLKASNRKQITNTVFRHIRQSLATGWYSMIKKFETGFLLSGINLPFIKLRVSIGETVIARMAAPIREKVLVNTSGENN